MKFSNFYATKLFSSEDDGDNEHDDENDVDDVDNEDENDDDIRNTTSELFQESQTIMKTCSNDAKDRRYDSVR